MILSIMDVDVTDYEIEELVANVQFLVVKSGELAGRRFPVWTGAIRRGEPVSVRFTEKRNWRTLWLRQLYITAWQAGGTTCRLTEEEPERVQRKLGVIYDNLSLHADPYGLS